MCFIYVTCALIKYLYRKHQQNAHTYTEKFIYTVTSCMFQPIMKPSSGKYNKKESKNVFALLFYCLFIDFIFHFALWNILHPIFPIITEWWITTLKLVCIPSITQYISHYASWILILFFYDDHFILCIGSDTTVILILYFLMSPSFALNLHKDGRMIGRNKFLCVNNNLQ